MTYRRLIVGSLLIIAATLVYTALMYSRLPDVITTHWDWNGQPNQFSPKNWAVAFAPIAQLAMLLIFVALPAISPPKASPSRFSDTYCHVVLLVEGFMGLLQVLTLEAAVRPVDISKWVVCGVLLLFGLMGNVLTRAKRNYWMGFRTPWTLESEEVWNRTHRFGGRLMFACSLVGLLLVLIGVQPMYVFWIVIAAILWPVVYSYLVFRKLRGGTL